MSRPGKKKERRERRPRGSTRARSGRPTSSSAPGPSDDASAPSGPGRLERLGAWVALGALLLPPLLVMPGAREPFRLPKQLLTELLVPLSVLLLALGLRRLQRVEWRTVLLLPAVRALAPLALVALASRLLSDHPAVAAEGLWSLGIGLLAIAAWSVALPAKRRALDLLAIPAGGLALIAVLQHYEIYRPFELLLASERLQMASLTGNVADLGAYLVLPLLVAQAGIARALAGGGKAPSRLALVGFALVALLALFTLLLGQTLSALAAAAAASGLFWLLRAPRRLRLPLAAAAGLAVLAGVLLVAPARERVLTKLDEVREGRVNDLLTGRLDGWRAGGAMLAAHPVLGVGPGAYRTEFVPAKLALIERGVRFWRGHTAGAQFANAHNEPVELAAELGVLGLLAVGWAGWVVLGCLRRRPLAPDPEDLDRDRRALQWSGLAALGLLSLTYFPLRTALVAYPYVLLLAWILEPSAGAGTQGREQAAEAAAPAEVAA